VERRILSIRGQRVLLDADLASLYGVPTRVLNQAVKRNLERFPADFMFRLTAAEKAEVITICDHLQSLRFSPSLPYAFTEHGAIMLASVLNTPIAVRGSVQVVRAFIRLREMLTAHRDLAQRLEELEKKYDAQFKAVFDAIRALMAGPEPRRRAIGFRVEEGRPAYRARKPRTVHGSYSMTKQEYAAVKNALIAASLDAADPARLTALPFDDGSRAARQANVALVKANAARLGRVLARVRADGCGLACAAPPARPGQRQ